MIFLKTILNKDISNYYYMVKDLQDLLTSKNIDFIHSVYIYGSFARDEIIPGLSDLDVMFFVNKEKISNENLLLINELNSTIRQKYDIPMVFRIHNLDELSSKIISEDLFVPYLFDLTINSFCIFGERIEYKFVEMLKNKSKEDFFYELQTTFYVLKQNFYDAYFISDKYKMSDVIYDFYRILNLFGVNFDFKLENSFKVKENVDKNTTESLLSIFSKIYSIYNEFNFEKLFEDIKQLNVLVGLARGGILYNLEHKKVLVIEHSFGGGGWWAYPKGGVEKGEFDDPSLTIKREIAEEVGITDVKIDLDKLFEINHYFKKSNYVYRKTKTEFFSVFCNTSQVVLSEEHNSFLWLNPSEVPNYVTSNGLKFVLDVFLKKHGIVYE